MAKIMKTWNGYEVHDAIARNKISNLEEKIDSLQQMVEGSGGTNTTEKYSWNDLIDKPFYDSSTTYLEWNGDITGMEYIEVEEDGESIPLLYKYSNSVCTKDELLDCTITMVAEYGGEESIEITEDMLLDIDDSGKLFAIGMGYVYIATEDCTLTEEGVSVNFTPGLWVISPLFLGGYISYIGKESEIKTLDIKFIPDELYTKIDERIDAYIEEALGGEY